MPKIDWAKVPLYFSYNEIKCRCGCGFMKVDEDFLIRLNMARHLAGFAFPITSWCRCTKYNIAIGGSATSSHLLGVAADIFLHQPALKYQAIDALHQAGLYRIGIGEDFIHVDHDLTKTQHNVWIYKMDRRAATWTEKESQKSYKECWHV